MRADQLGECGRATRTAAEAVRTPRCDKIDGVSELVIATGRPIAMKQKGAYVNLTARPLTLPMLTALVEGTSIAAVIPKADGSQDLVEIDVGRRKLRLRTGRRGDEIVVRLEQVAKPATSPAAMPTITA